MQPYQEEYIANLQRIGELTALKRSEHYTFDEYYGWVMRDNQEAVRLSKRNMELLEKNYIPVMDKLLEQDKETLADLDAFADALMKDSQHMDMGLYCHIHEGLLAKARLEKKRERIIVRLYELGMGRFSYYNMIDGFPFPEVDYYVARMRFCFVEAGAYLKYFDEIEDTQTKGYIIRALANVSLGRFSDPGRKADAVRRAMRVIEDPEYRKKAPELPWDTYWYKVNQQMTTVQTSNDRRRLQQQDVASVMEAAHLVYEKQLEKARGEKKAVPARWLYPYYRIEYYCGILSLPEFLGEVEKMMDRAKEDDFSDENIYVMISLTAIYSNYLMLHPEALAPRRQYLCQRYRMVKDYIQAYPREKENERLFFALRQFLIGFQDVEGGPDYEFLVLEMLVRFCPELYVHSYVTGRLARELCETIIDGDMDFFDDMDEVRTLREPEEKRRFVGRFAMVSGIIHDIGKLDMLSLFSEKGRELLEEEYEMAKLHVKIGSTHLRDKPSTRCYADIALGHHVWYDGSRGYPEDYKRLDSRYRQMVDVIALANWLENRTNTAMSGRKERFSFADAVRKVSALAGRRFSPLVTAWLQDPGLFGRLEAILKNGRREAYETLYRWKNGEGTADEDSWRQEIMK